MHKVKENVPFFNSSLQESLLKKMPCPYLVSRSVGKDCCVDVIDFRRLGGHFTLFVSNGDESVKFDYKTMKGALNQACYWITCFHRLWSLLDDKAKYSRSGKNETAEF